MPTPLLMRAVATALFLALVLAAPVAAQPPVGHVDAATVQRIVSVADAHWPANLCAGATTVATLTSAEAAAIDPLYASAAGFAPLGAAYEGRCTLWIISDVFGEDGWRTSDLCAVVAHELGHLLGHDHVADPSHVMFPTLLAPTPQCAAAFPQPTIADEAPAPAPTPIDVPRSPDVRLRAAVERDDALVLRLANRPHDASVVVRLYDRTARSPIIGRRVYSGTIRSGVVYLPGLAGAWDRMELRYVGGRRSAGSMIVADRCVLGQHSRHEFFGFDPSAFNARCPAERR